jgi:hypothetical protein
MYVTHNADIVATQPVDTTVVYNGGSRDVSVAVSPGDTQQASTTLDTSFRRPTDVAPSTRGNYKRGWTGDSDTQQLP